MKLAHSGGKISITETGIWIDVFTRLVDGNMVYLANRRRQTKQLFTFARAGLVSTDDNEVGILTSKDWPLR